MSNHRANDGSNEAQYTQKKQKYVFKTILKTASKTCYNEVKSPRLRISDLPKVPYFAQWCQRQQHYASCLTSSVLLFANSDELAVLTIIVVIIVTTLYLLQKC